MKKPMDIVCSRGFHGPVVNVPYSIKRHSSEFEWGYGGSGPADLALNILLLFVPLEKADLLYQEFKWKFIATLPYKGGVIPHKEILDWIQTKEDANEAKSP